MELITTKVCMTKDIGVHGNLFGGKMLAWLDEAGAAYACQLAHSTKMVTRHISEVEFSKPVREGRIVKIYGQAIHYGKTSIKIHMEARAHNPHSGEQKIVCSTDMVFVRIDDDGDALPLEFTIKDKTNGTK
tara:strand:+ start:1680 stop:2072 length:393 start_codon:yes stop_codon:yes gene_type:complete